MNVSPQADGVRDDYRILMEQKIAQNINIASKNISISNI